MRSEQAKQEAIRAVDRLSNEDELHGDTEDWGGRPRKPSMIGRSKTMGYLTALVCTSPFPVPTQDAFRSQAAAIVETALKHRRTDAAHELLHIENTPLSKDPVGDWLEDNATRLEDYRQEYVALTEDGVVFSSKDYRELVAWVRKNGLEDTVEVLFVK